MNEHQKRRWLAAGVNYVCITAWVGFM